MPNIEILDPWKWGTAFVASLAGYFGLLNSLGALAAPYWAFVVETSTWWFGGITVFSGFVAPTLGDPWQSYAEGAALLAAVAFVGIAAVKVGASAKRRAV